MADIGQININPSPAPTPKTPNTKLWIIVIAVLLILAGGYFLNAYKNKPKPKEYTIPGNTLADVPFPKFPTELVPEGATPPKYFDNQTATGAWFIVKQTVDQFKLDYEKKLMGTAWELTTIQASSSPNILFLNNKETKVSGRISFDVLPDKATVVTVGIIK